MWPAPITDRTSSSPLPAAQSTITADPPAASTTARPSTGGGGGGSGHSSGRLTRIPSFGKALRFKNKKDNNKPPPPPPKDVVAYAAASSSQRVLSPDTLSIPPTSPISPSSSPYHHHHHHHHNHLQYYNSNTSTNSSNNINSSNNCSSNSNSNNNNNAPYHSRTTPGPSQSSVSLISLSAASARSQQTLETRQSRLRAKASSLFTFVKRSSARSVKSPPDPDFERPTTAPGPQQGGDPGISTPWNFQHNIHVDEAFIGLPPSWSTQLSQAGFSPEEIAALQARRMNIYTGRPDSPNLRINTAPLASTTLIIGRPSPGEGGGGESMSPGRQSSDASLRSSSQGGHSQPASSPPPRSTSITQNPLISSPSSVSLHSVRTTTTTNSVGKPLSSPNGYHKASTSSGSERSTSVVGSEPPTRTDHDSSLYDDNEYSRQPPPPPAVPPAPSTPPRRTLPLHVVNAQIMASPPPAYSQFITYTPDKKAPIDAEDKQTFNIDEDDTVAGTQVTPLAHRSQQKSTESNTKPPTTTAGRRVSIIRNKRNSILPPRLSLHKTSDSLDLTSWSADLLSGISSSSGFSSNRSNGSSRSGQREWFTTPSTNMTSPLSRPSSSKSDPPSRSPLAVQEPIGPSPSPPPPLLPQATHRRQGSSRARPVPPIILAEDPSENDNNDDDDDDDDNAPPPPTGWAEQGSATRLSPSAFSPLPPLPLPSPPPTAATQGLDSAALSGAMGQFDGLIDKEADLRGLGSFDPALEDAHSPVLPISPRPVGEAAWSRSPVSPPSLPPPPTPREGHRQLLSVPGERVKQEKDEEQAADVGDNDDDPDESFLMVDDASADTHRGGGYRYSSRSSSSTMSTISTATVIGYGEHALVRNASVIRRTSAYVIDTAPNSAAAAGAAAAVWGRLPQLGITHPQQQQHYMRPPSSPMSSYFGSEEGSSLSSGSPSQDRHPTPTETDSPLNYYMGATYTPSPSRLTFATKAPVHLLVSTSGTFGGGVRDVLHEDDEDEGEDEDEDEGDNEVEMVEQQELQEQDYALQRPRIVINSTDTSPTAASSTTLMTTPGGITPQTPAPRYRGWLSEVVRPLEDFIDEAIDPREYYIDLTEIAEGESGSVFAAQLAPNRDLARLRLDPTLVAQDRKTLASGEPVAVAIKSVAILPSGPPKLLDLERELKLMRGLQHENILSMDALYVDLVEDSLWIRMELMERSLADVVSLVEAGLMLHDRMIARFANDVILALQFLQKRHIAHRDLRSDNLLLNIQGVVKLADFSTALQVSPSAPLRSDIVGVAYWQAPEVRAGPYNVLKVDIWSLGATVWELAEAEPPFSGTQQLLDRWPPLSRPKLFSPAFHDFLSKCSEPAESRPDADQLSSHPFMKNACGRGVIIQLLAQSMTIEKQQFQNEES